MCDRQPAPAQPQEAAPSATPWWAAYPEPQSKPARISREEVLQMLKTKSLGERDFILVDVRRNDFEGGTVQGSINLPAQSLYPTIASVYTVFKAAGVKKAIFYCGSSSGRGPRSAAWLADHISRVGDTTMESLILEGGIKGWVNAGPEYVEWMDGYNAEVWKKLDGGH
ncbi:rhodanese-like domain-containing protein [Thermochaetoides thermophila DSM 1495]|uniref:Rhodanese-like domain-containing protein n=1 Tax=Chaetomium thermophilum (strain DSM 1495 / CBS 144.50 / IMI 039719) TaxID=759272 RepID=G0SEK7_CHATD|nr:rhodanese-like domain-containing protein [Thermochaetoides thermophila DSM 1495]EGS18384.1 rhodanese-like domain-containing protein [Thermochaetoides thermophila DSM 1495]